MQENNIVFPLMDVSEPENRQTLLEVGGKVQVPCLFINGKPMYESNDIINYLNK
jgi:glutaredoxin